MTYRQLEHEVDRLAHGLLRLGFVKGDRLGVWLPNCSQYLVTQLAAAKLGVILANINPAYRLAEAEYALRLVGMKGIIIQPSLRTTNYAEMLATMLPELREADSHPTKRIQSQRLPELRYVINIGAKRLPGVLQYDEDVLGDKHQKPPHVPWRLHQDDDINIQFTSGTTGSPKGVILTHTNILNNGFFVGERLRLTSHDRVCVPVPLYHCFGLVMGNIASFTHGAALIYPTEVFDPEAVLKTVEAEKCTVLHGVPTMFITELNHANFAKYDLSTLRTGIMAGSVCPLETMKEVISRMHLREVTICYGMTETSPVSFQSHTDDPLNLRVETVGRVHPHLHCKVVDEQGNTVPVGVSGELLTKGYSVMRGYWGDPAKTDEVLTWDGWMHTGDLATIDENGYCRIVGRIKDLIIRGGENISPRELEDILFEHPAVQSPSIIGVPDEFYGEQVCAWIILKDGHESTKKLEDDLRQYLRDRVAHYKVPKYILFKKDFPMTASGKIQKFIMTNMTTKELGLKGKK